MNATGRARRQLEQLREPRLRRDRLERAAAAVRDDAGLLVQAPVQRLVRIRDRERGVRDAAPARWLTT